MNHLIQSVKSTDDQISRPEHIFIETNNSVSNEDMNSESNAISDQSTEMQPIYKCIQVTDPALDACQDINFSPGKLKTFWIDDRQRLLINGISKTVSYMTIWL